MKESKTGGDSTQKECADEKGQGSLGPTLSWTLTRGVHSVVVEKKEIHGL